MRLYYTSVVHILSPMDMERYLIFNDALRSIKGVAKGQPDPAGPKLKLILPFCHTLYTGTQFPFERTGLAPLVLRYGGGYASMLPKDLYFSRK